MTAGGAAEQHASRIGAFVLEGVLGQGGMGIVYRARHAETGVAAAIKTVRRASEKHLASLRREFHALAQLQHRGVVRFLDYGIDAGLPWCAMELLEGETLETYRARLWSAPPEPRVAAAGRLPEVLTIARSLCDSLAFVHGKGIVHGDVKPQNVFLRPDGSTVLVDFGISRRIGHHGREVADLPAFDGTPRYMAPNQITSGLLDPRDDLYAVGCTLFELVTGFPLFDKENGLEVAWSHLRERPRAPSSLAAGVPNRLDNLISALLEKHPGDRPGHAAEVSDTLLAIGALGRRRSSPSIRALLYRPRLVGRDEHLGRLEGLIRQLGAGRGGIALISGESGIGKSYLAAEASRMATRTRARVVHSSCASTGAAPLHPFRETLAAIADTCAAGGERCFERLLGERAALLACIEPAVGAIAGGADSLQPAASIGAGDGDRLVSGLLESLHAFAREEPLLLVLDDLQWADELTWRVLELLAASAPDGPPLLVLGTYRSDELGPAGARHLGRIRAVELKLERLDTQAVRSLLADMLAVNDPPADLVEFATEQSAGNPFFVGEYLRSAIDEGQIRRSGRRSIEWAPGLAAAGSPAGGTPTSLPAMLPAMLPDLVGRRLARLGERARDRAEMAAVLGREIDSTLLDTAAGVDDSATHELLTSNVLESPGGPVLRFAHDKLREAAYALIPPDRRARLHLAAARALEAVHGNTPELPTRSAELAHHYLQAGRREQAADYLEKAGTYALSVGAFDEAVGHLERCLALCEPRPPGAANLRVVRLHRQLSDAFTGVGNLAGRDAEARQAIVQAGQAPARPAALAVPRALSLLALQSVRRGAVTAVESGPTRELCLEVSRALRHLAAVYFFQNRKLSILFPAVDAVSLAERAGPSGELARAYAELGGLLGVGGLSGAARWHQTRAIAVASEVGDRLALAYSQFLRGFYSVGVGAWDDTREGLDACRAICESTLDHLTWGNAQVVRFWMHHYRAEDAEARAAAEALLARARKVDNVQQRRWAQSALGLSALRRGDPAAAVRVLEESLQAHETTDQNNLVLSMGSLALAHHRLGEAETARAHAMRAVETLAEIRQPTGHASLEGGSGVAEVLLRAGDRPSREAALAVDYLRRYRQTFPIGEARYQLWRGVLLRGAGSPRRAIRAWRAGLSAARAFGMGHDEELLRRELQVVGALPGQPEAALLDR